MTLFFNCFQMQFSTSTLLTINTFLFIFISNPFRIYYGYANNFVLQLGFFFLSLYFVNNTLKSAPKTPIQSAKDKTVDSQKKKKHRHHQISKQKYHNANSMAYKSDRESMQLSEYIFYLERTFVKSKVVRHFLRIGKWSSHH